MNDRVSNVSMSILSSSLYSVACKGMRLSGIRSGGWTWTVSGSFSSSSLDARLQEL